MGFWDTLKKKEENKGPYIPPQVSFDTNGSTPQTFDGSFVEAAKGTGKFVLDQAQASGQASMRAFAGVAGAVTGTPLTPTGQFQEDLYGTDKPITLTSVGRETRLADPDDESKGFWGTFDPALGLFVGLADAVPGGKGAKVFKAAISTIGKATDEASVIKTISTAFPKIANDDSLIKTLAQNLARESDPKAVERQINYALSKVDEQSKATAPRKYSYENLPAPKADDEVVVSFAETKGGKQYVNTDISAQRQYDGEPHFGVVKRSELEDVGKAEGGVFTIPRDKASQLIAENVAPPKPAPIRNSMTGRLEGSVTNKPPTEAFGAVAGAEDTDGDGMPDNFDPLKAALGFAAVGAVNRAKGFNIKKGATEGFKQADYEITSEMLDLAQAGKRLIKEDGSVQAVSSTFPKWVPEELRSKDLFEKAVGYYESGKTPPASATRINELLSVMQKELVRRTDEYDNLHSLERSLDGDTGITDAPNLKTQEGPLEAASPASKTDIPPPITEPGIPKVDSISSAKTIPQKFNAVFANVVEFVQNSEKRVLDLTKRKDLNTAVDPYEIMTLYHGRVGTKIKEGYNKAEEIAEDIISFAGRNRTNVNAGRAEVNKYLQALHAPERNAALGDGAAGITTAEATEVTRTASPEVKAAAEKALDLNRQTLDLLKESSVITEDLYTTLRTKYKNHVPLQRVMDEQDDIGDVLSGRSFDVRGTGIKTAKGSDKEVADVLTNIVNNYEQAVLRSEKNIVDRATLQFVRNNKDDVAHLMEEKHPRAVGTDHSGKPLMEQTQDPTILQMYEDGKRVWIQFHDPKLAIAFRGVGKEKTGVIINAVGAFTRFYSGLATRFNPEFALPNKLRDLQETMTYLAAQGDIGFKGAAKAAVRDPASMKAVLDGVRGADTAGAKLYQEMKSLGGTTGGMGLSTRKQTELNIDSIFNIARSRPRKAAAKLVEYVDNWNTIFEDSTRLSVYKTALEGGATKERAAFLAKEASINFNRSGTGGPVINALWMFSNASIQGSAKMMKAMKNPKVAAGVTAAVGASVAAVSEWNDQVDPEWRDKVTKWDRLNGLPIILPTEDGSTRYFTIPVSWGIKPIMVMANSAYDAVSGIDIDPTEALGSVMSAALDAYNPVGGTDLTSALIPTIGDVPVEVARNQAWSGALIRPVPYNNEPKDIQYFRSLDDTAQGRGAIATTKKLQEQFGILLSPADINYVIDQYVGGAGRSIKKTSELLYGLSSDADTPPADEWPFVSRFLRQRTSEETGQGAGGEIEKLKENLSEQARERFQANEEAEAMYKSMKELPQEVAAARFEVLRETNPDTAKKLVDIAKDEAKGLTYQDKLVKALGVENGERSRYIIEQLNKAKTDEEKARLWEEYNTKGLITKDVAKQLKYLLTH